MNIARLGDAIAIPLFIILAYYMWNIQNRNHIENILLVFGIGGAIADLYFILKEV